MQNDIRHYYVVTFDNPENEWDRYGKRQRALVSTRVPFTIDAAPRIYSSGGMMSFGSSKDFASKNLVVLNDYGVFDDFEGYDEDGFQIGIHPTERYVLEYPPQPFNLDEMKHRITYGGWCAPDGTYYLAQHEDHTGLASDLIVTYHMLKHSDDYSSMDTLYRHGWLCVSWAYCTFNALSKPSDENLYPTPEQFVVLERIRQHLVDSNYPEIVKNIDTFKTLIEYANPERVK